MSLLTGRLLTIIVAVPVFIFLPLASAALAMTVKQLIFGFDDQPLFAMMVGLTLGTVASVVALTMVCRTAFQGACRNALAIIFVAGIFDLAVLPIGRTITQYVEHPDRFLDNDQ